MIPDKLKDDFNSLRNMFDELKREIDKNVVKEENYKGPFVFIVVVLLFEFGKMSFHIYSYGLYFLIGIFFLYLL